LNIGNLVGTRKFREFVGTVDTTDMYRFSLAGTSNLNILIDALTSYTDMDLIFDANNNGLIDSGEILLKDFSDGDNNITLGAGTYFVRMNRAYTASNTNYDLSLTTTALPPSTASDPGSTFATALNIGNLVGSRTFREFVGIADTTDMYRFTLTRSSSVNILIDAFTSYTDMDLIFDANNNGLVDSGEILLEDFSDGDSNITLGAGTYFVRMNRAYTDSNTNYNLTLTAVPQLPGLTATSDVTYTLPSQSDNLVLTGAATINGTGNGRKNTIIGNTANNRLNGLGGSDTLEGNSGNDILTGGNGNDLLTGGSGKDQFVFNSNAVFNLSAMGLDRITDFVVGTDKLVLDKTTFTLLGSQPGNGFGMSADFAAVTNDAIAATSAALITYSRTTGNLFYNLNGTATGFGGGGHFVVVNRAPALTAGDFVIAA
jgi:Ca2+-binding RTX toxin-like protein